MAIKVKKINEEGKEIIKDIDDALYSAYINTGWEVVKDKKPSIIASKSMVKEDKEEKNGKDL